MFDFLFEILDISEFLDVLEILDILEISEFFEILHFFSKCKKLEANFKAIHTKKTCRIHEKYLNIRILLLLSKLHFHNFQNRIINYESGF